MTGTRPTCHPMSSGLDANSVVLTPNKCIAVISPCYEDVSTSSRLNGDVTENAGIERPMKSYRLARAARFRVRGVSENDGVS